jgi:aminodeoxyfutalosine synthase
MQSTYLLDRIATKIDKGERILATEALALFQSPEILPIGELAELANRKKNGNRVFYNINRHINPTNICALSCKFCSFSKKPGEEGAYAYTMDEILQKAQQALDQGAREVHMVGGLHPRWKYSHYTDMIREIKTQFPTLHIKALTAVEIDWLAKKGRKSIAEVLGELKEAGLDSMPGGGAEIFHPEIREKICDTKVPAELWLDIHRTAHKMGLRSNCTMLYGHIEQFFHRVDHMQRLRDLQDETGGFNVFIPLAFQPFDNEMNINRYTAGYDDLKTLAVARLFLDNFDHIKAYWVMLGQDTAQLGLNFGANDLDGTVTEEKISRMAGGRAGMVMSRSNMEALIHGAGKYAVERDTLYRPIPAASSKSPGLSAAATLAELKTGTEAKTGVESNTGAAVQPAWTSQIKNRESKSIPSWLMTSGSVLDLYRWAQNQRSPSARVPNLSSVLQLAIHWTDSWSLQDAKHVFQATAREFAPYSTETLPISLELPLQIAAIEKVTRFAKGQQCAKDQEPAKNQQSSESQHLADFQNADDPWLAGVILKGDLTTFLADQDLEPHLSLLANVTQSPILIDDALSVDLSPFAHISQDFLARRIQAHQELHRRDIRSILSWNLCLPEDASAFSWDAFAQALQLIKKATSHPASGFQAISLTSLGKHRLSALEYLKAALLAQWELGDVVETPLLGLPAYQGLDASRLVGLYSLKYAPLLPCFGLRRLGRLDPAQLDMPMIWRELTSNGLYSTVSAPGESKETIVQFTDNTNVAQLLHRPDAASFSHPRNGEDLSWMQAEWAATHRKGSQAPLPN